MISPAAENAFQDAYREAWRRSIPRHLAASSRGSGPAPRSKRPEHDLFEDFLREMARTCGTGPGAALSSKEISACAGLQPAFERHKKHGAKQIGYWFAPRHGRAYGPYRLRRIQGRQGDPMRWYADVAA
jgi:hypothetical protein